MLLYRKISRDESMTFDEQYYSIGYLDRLSYRNTFVHRLDPRIKLVTTLLFLFTVISFSKYEVAALLPFFLFPVILLTAGEIPPGLILRKVAVVSPFAIFIGIFNPLLDARPVAVLPGMTLAAGWFSFASILLKFILTVSTALLLVATTSFPTVCHALRRLGLPSIFVSQLLFLYRYIFVLAEETMRVVRARDMRSFGHRGASIKIFIRITGVLFLRTVERAERIYYAMLARGFRGDMPANRRYSIATRDLVFAGLVAACLFVFRFYPVSVTLGRYFQELFL